MRKLQNRQPLTSVFTSKRFVVALCAAIAMVLGAMSVGANTPAPEVISEVPYGMSSQETIPVVQNDSSSSSTVEVSPLPPTKFFDRQILTNTPEPNHNAPLSSPPKMEIKVKANPLNITITTPIDEALIKAGDLLPDVSLPIGEPEGKPIDSLPETEPSPTPSETEAQESTILLQQTLQLSSTGQ